MDFTETVVIDIPAPADWVFDTDSDTVVIDIREVLA